MTSDPIDFVQFYQRFLAAVQGGTVRPIYRPDGQGFCYAEGIPDRVRFWEVEMASGTRKPFLNPARARRALQAELGHALPFRGLPFDNFEFVGASTIRFSIDRQPAGMVVPATLRLLDPDAATWLVDLDLDTYAVSRVPHAEKLRRSRAMPRNVRKGVLASDPGPSEVPSPDGRWLLGERDWNLVLRAVVDDRTSRLTTDGTEDDAWRVDGAVWSKDSARVAATRTNTSECRRMPLVEWLKPYEEVRFHPVTRVGGALPTQAAAVIDVRSGAVVNVDLPGERDQTVSPAGWRHDGAEAYFITTDRRQKYLRLFAADPATGAARQLCEEVQDTFIIGIRAVERFSPAMLLEDDERILWYSERDGWRHLYLYRTDGERVGRLTSGEFEVLSVVSVDLDRDTVYFTAHSDLDRPYDVHLCRVGLDGSGFRQLTSAAGLHSPVPTPGKTHFIDTHSAIDRPPSVDLVTADGEVPLVLASADVGGLAQLGLVPPEPFTVLAADGETTLHGVLYKPPGFDASKKYPVIEEIYGGPQESIHQVAFVDGRGLAAMMKASLGFVVYAVDGRGTPNRGKAFQDVAYGRFHEFHVEDHRHVLQEMLERHPFMDRRRVGVTGGSWGGYNTVRSMLLAPQLYHVGVAVCPVYDLEDHQAQALEPYMGLPIDRPQAYAAGSSLDIAGNLAGRLLMIHGTSDVNATFSATMKMCEALARADRPYDLIVMPDADHHFNNAGQHQGSYMQASTLRYFVEHLRPVSPAKTARTRTRK
jgi:dipeptidyl-peptidase-4